jgi:molybdopterin-guanine dinucleotide biosynthesis protein A
MSVQTTAGAILAGGQARRFGGRDKSRLEIDGSPIIVRQVELLQRTTDEVFLVGHDPARFADLGLPVFPDRVSGAGALGGIYTALASTSADRVLVIACDMPFLVEGLLRALLIQAGTGDGAWVRTARGPEPLVACYRQSALAAIHDAIVSGHFKAADMGQYLKLAELSEEDVQAFGPPDHVLANLNSPEDYARVQ